jgi:three-Cys-motif partner protein
VLGSPLNALLVRPAFREHYLIDLDGDKIDGLREIVGERPDVHLHHGDCNKVRLEEVFPKVHFKDYKRGLCLLDPYKLTLQWKVIQEAGSMRSLDVFLNFPIHDINRTVLFHRPEKVSPANIARMNAYWGDQSWEEVALRQEPRPVWPKRCREGLQPEICGSVSATIKESRRFREGS